MIVRFIKRLGTVAEFLNPHLIWIAGFLLAGDVLLGRVWYHHFSVYPRATSGVVAFLLVSAGWQAVKNRSRAEKYREYYEEVLEACGWEKCRNGGCEKPGVQEIQANDASGHLCEDHWMVGLMFGGELGDRRKE